MIADVEIVEGGRLINTEKMKLKMVKEFRDDLFIYETEDGRAVIYSKKNNKYILISIDIA